MNPPPDAALVVLVMGLVAMLRKEWPRIDGLKLVLPLTMVLGEVVSYAADSSSLRAAAIKGIWVGFGALGFASGGSYLATKLGNASSSSNVAVAVSNPKEEPKPAANGGLA